MRYAVTFVDDAYGRVGRRRGASTSSRRAAYTLVGSVAYDPRDVDMPALVRRIAAACDPDVLFVSAYLDDAVAMRREMVRRACDLLVGHRHVLELLHAGVRRALGAEAVGLFASDKPDSDAMNAEGLAPEAAPCSTAPTPRTATATARHERRGAGRVLGARGRSSTTCCPRRATLTPEAVADAAIRAAISRGAASRTAAACASARPGEPGAGANLAAASVDLGVAAPGEHAVGVAAAVRDDRLRPMDPLP